MTQNDQTPLDSPDGIHKNAGKLAHLVEESATQVEEAAGKLASCVGDYIHHPAKIAEIGASLAEGLAGASLGEMLGAGLGAPLGPVGMALGVAAGSVAGEVIGARHGEHMAKKLLHLEGESAAEHGFKEDLEAAGSASIGSHAGQVVGEAIGAALLGESGAEIGKQVGDKMGNLFGMLGFEHLAEHDRDKLATRDEPEIPPE